MKNRAFTLIELLVVVLIIGILAAVAVPQYQVAVIKTRINSAKQTVNDIKRAIDLYYLQHNEYPKKFQDLDFAHTLEDSRYIRIKGGSCYIDTSTWNEIYCDIGNWQIIYLISLQNSSAQCRVYTPDKTDAYHRACQQDTGKTASQANCESNNSYCRYFYD